MRRFKTKANILTTKMSFAKVVFAVKNDCIFLHPNQKQKCLIYNNTNPLNI